MDSENLAPNFVDDETTTTTKLHFGSSSSVGDEHCNSRRSRSDSLGSATSRTSSFSSTSSRSSRGRRRRRRNNKGKSKIVVNLSASNEQRAAEILAKFSKAKTDSDPGSSRSGSSNNNSNGYIPGPSPAVLALLEAAATPTKSAFLGSRHRDLTPVLERPGILGFDAIDDAAMLLSFTRRDETYSQVCDARNDDRVTDNALDATTAADVVCPASAKAQVIEEEEQEQKRGDVCLMSIDEHCSAIELYGQIAKQENAVVADCDSDSVELSMSPEPVSVVSSTTVLVDQSIMTIDTADAVAEVGTTLVTEDTFSQKVVVVPDCDTEPVSLVSPITVLPDQLVTIIDSDGKEELKEEEDQEEKRIDVCCMSTDERCSAIELYGQVAKGGKATAADDCDSDSVELSMSVEPMTNNVEQSMKTDITNAAVRGVITLVAEEDILSQGVVVVPDCDKTKPVSVMLPTTVVAYHSPITIVNTAVDKEPSTVHSNPSPVSQVRDDEDDHVGVINTNGSTTSTPDVTSSVKAECVESSSSSECKVTAAAAVAAASVVGASTLQVKAPLDLSADTIVESISDDDQEQEADKLVFREKDVSSEQHRAVDEISSDGHRVVSVVSVTADDALLTDSEAQYASQQHVSKIESLAAPETEIEIKVVAGGTNESTNLNDKDDIMNKKDEKTASPMSTPDDNLAVVHNLVQYQPVHTEHAQVSKVWEMSSSCARDALRTVFASVFGRLMRVLNRVYNGASFASMEARQRVGRLMMVVKLKVIRMFMQMKTKLLAGLEQVTWDNVGDVVNAARPFKDLKKLQRQDVEQLLVKHTAEAGVY